MKCEIEAEQLLCISVPQKKTDVTLILACMMVCVWRSTTNWVFYAIAQRDIVARTVKVGHVNIHESMVTPDWQHTNVMLVHSVQIVVVVIPSGCCSFVIDSCNCQPFCKS